MGTKRDNQAELVPALDSPAYDAVALEILWGRLVAIVDESAAVLQRTSFSTIVREANDLSCVLMSSSGFVLAENTLGVPSFAGVMSRVMGHFLHRYPPEAWRPGDVGLTNDPWLNAGHLPDTTVVTPIFRHGSLVAFAGNTAHKADIGGIGYAADATSIYDEGLRIPICKLSNAGEIDEGLTELIKANVRVPHLVMGDLLAQVNAGHVCTERLLQFMDEQGIDDLGPLGQQIQSRSERAMRAAIAELPDGEYASTITSDGFETPTVLKTRIVVDNDALRVDYSGSSAQVPHGINTVYNYTYALTCYTLKCLLDPLTRKNEASYRPFEVVAPEGSILNARFPAPVMARAMTGQLVSSAVLAALADALPERVIADSGSCPGLRISLRGVDRHGRPFAQMLFSNGGMGARAHADGLSTTGFPSNAGGGSVEVLEATAPVIVWRKEFSLDSGGAGRRRGGLGQHVEIGFVGDGPIDIATQFDRVEHPAGGLFGGLPGGRSQLALNENTVPSKGRIKAVRGDRLILDFAGGGGYGPPIERDRMEVAMDLRNGIISAAAAEEHYGYEAPPPDATE